MTIKQIILAHVIVAVVGLGAWAGYGYHQGYFDPEPTPEEQTAISEEYLRLLKERNDAMEELIELYELRILEIQGKLHSS